MFFVFILFLHFQSEKEIIIYKNKWVLLVQFVITGMVSMYFAIALGLSYVGDIKTANAMYPFNTENTILLLLSAGDIQSQAMIADDILSQNEFVQIAYSAKAQYAYVQGDFESLIKLKHKIFTIAPFSYNEYDEYSQMLIQGIYLYQKNGDNSSANICKQELINTRNKLHSIEDKLSHLGKMIREQILLL